nr:acetate--CoA ligase family protein [Parabacteroides johnsonii]
MKEMDINPLLATKKGIIAVDARIRIEKEAKNK